MRSAPKRACKILVPLPPPRRRRIFITEMMTDEMNQDDVQQPTLKPSLTGDLMLDNALERLRRTLDARAKKEATKQPELANRHDSGDETS